MNRSNTPVALTIGVLLMFFLSAYQLATAQQKVQYQPDFGDDAGATCCIGHETCEVQATGPSRSCFYALYNGALPTWYDCVAVTCDLWPNTTCWADATKARHEMGWDGAYLACDYGPALGREVGEKCCDGPACTEACLYEAFYTCVADRCRVWDGTAKDCEKDAKAAAPKSAKDCIP